jgi:hypothetical protein
MFFRSLGNMPDPAYSPGNAAIAKQPPSAGQDLASPPFLLAFLLATSQLAAAVPNGGCRTSTALRRTAQ